MDPNKSVKVTYRDGAFHPDAPCDLPEGFETTITLTTAAAESRESDSELAWVLIDMLYDSQRPLELTLD